ncbi:hypothetical protein GCM10022377_05700 [Zhihengliuella alba]|uniref:Uncharacterized protein n=1 Tax=Zhihengliuella alba TaxID=547018 RepID=A0ABP7CWH4_9MICC
MANAVKSSTNAVDPMHSEQPGHGNSVAAWTMVAVMLVGVGIGCVGYGLASVTVVIVGLAVVAVGLIAGWVLKKAGFGVGGHKSKSGH